MFLVYSTILWQLQKLCVHKRKHSYEIRTPKLLRYNRQKWSCYAWKGQTTAKSVRNARHVVRIRSWSHPYSKHFPRMFGWTTLFSREVTHPRLCVPTTLRCAGMVTDWMMTDGMVTDGMVTDWMVSDWMMTDGMVTDGMVTDWIQPWSKDWLSRTDSESVDARMPSPSLVCLQNTSADGLLVGALCHCILLWEPLHPVMGAITPCCECHHILLSPITSCCECHHTLLWEPLHSAVSPITSSCECNHNLLGVPSYPFVSAITPCSHYILCECHHILLWGTLYPVVSYNTAYCEFHYSLLWEPLHLVVSSSTPCCECCHTLLLVPHVLLWVPLRPTPWRPRAGEEKRGQV